MGLSEMPRVPAGNGRAGQGVNGQDGPSSRRAALHSWIVEGGVVAGAVLTAETSRSNGEVARDCFWLPFQPPAANMVQDICKTRISCC
jgi:hypothetical protein